MTVLYKLAAVALSAVTLIAASDASAQAIICGQPYEIKRGDRLSTISRRAYGKSAEYLTIYNANIAVIGPNPAEITEGVFIDIPCQNEELELSDTFQNAFRIKSTPLQGAIPPAGNVRVVAGTDWMPFVHANQAEGGMVTEIVDVALKNATGSPEYKIDFINDWGVHLRPLISDHAYDFSLAWFRPNCAQVDKLSDGSKFRCNNLDWSDALFEQQFGYFTRKDAPAPKSYADFKGKTICRPVGYATFQLEENDLKEPAITLERPLKVSDCFTGLANGDYDVVAMAVDTAKSAMKETGTTDKITQHENLLQTLTIHAVIAKTHPRKQELLATLNSGIGEIKQNGQWFSIVRRHLTEFHASAK